MPRTFSENPASFFFHSTLLNNWPPILPTCIFNALYAAVNEVPYFACIVGHFCVRLSILCVFPDSIIPSFHMETSCQCFLKLSLSTYPRSHLLLLFWTVECLSLLLIMILCIVCIGSQIISLFLSLFIYKNQKMKVSRFLRSFFSFVIKYCVCQVIIVIVTILMVILSVISKYKYPYVIPKYILFSILYIK